MEALTLSNTWSLGGHFRWGYLDDGSFFCQSGKCSRDPDSGFEEAQRAAQDIQANAQRLNQPIVLCMSGGIDSEAMAQAFMAKKIEFEVAILRFKDELNWFDIKSGVEFCEDNNLNYQFYDVDVLDFFESGIHLHYGQLYRCQSPQLAMHLFFLDHIEGFPVVGGQPIEIGFYKGQFKHYGLPGELHTAYHRYMQRKRRHGVPSFFTYSPELILSMLKVRTISDLLKQGFQGKSAPNSYSVKVASYREAGFNVSPRENKFTGFEKVREHYDKIDSDSHGQAFDRRYRRPLEENSPFPKFQKQYIPSDLEEWVQSHRPNIQNLRGQLSCSAHSLS